MTREARTLFLGILTLIVYAVSIYFTQGSFVFPFPLNEFIFLAVVLQFVWWNRSKSFLLSAIPILAGICGVLSTQFLWSFFFRNEQMELFMQGLTTDFFLIGYYFFILLGGILTMSKQRQTSALALSGLFVLAFVSGVFLNHPLLILLAYAFMVAATQLSKVFAPYHLLWILLFVLKLSEWLTFLLNS